MLFSKASGGLLPITIPATPYTFWFTLIERYRHLALDKVSVVAPACLLLLSTHVATALSLSQIHSSSNSSSLILKTCGSPNLPPLTGYMIISLLSSFISWFAVMDIISSISPERCSSWFVSNSTFVRYAAWADCFA